MSDILFHIVGPTIYIRRHDGYKLYITHAEAPAAGTGCSPAPYSDLVRNAVQLPEGDAFRIFA